jgi:DnaJ family protein A protein 2
MWKFGFSNSPQDEQDNAKASGCPPNTASTHRKLYDLLGIEPIASMEEIKKAWRKTAAMHHPDRGGDPVKFQEARNAYEILADPISRERYNQLGDVDFVSPTATTSNAPNSSDDLKEHLKGFYNVYTASTGGFNVEEILQDFKKRGTQKSSPKKPFNAKTTHQRKGADITLQCCVTLQELYTGCTKVITRKRIISCLRCDGIGDTTGKQVCGHCAGAGKLLESVQYGKFVSFTPHWCSFCRGSGMVIKEPKHCVLCSGKKVIEELIDLHVVVTPGMVNGEILTYPGMGDQDSIDIEPGSIFVTLVETPHSEFERRGNDLTYKCQIALLEALTGVQLQINHLDSRIIKIAFPEHRHDKFEMIRPGKTIVIHQEGMPVRDNPMMKGDLIVQFEVLFPTVIATIVPKDYEMLKRYLPTGEKTHPIYAEQLFGAREIDVKPPFRRDKKREMCGLQVEEENDPEKKELPSSYGHKETTKNMHNDALLSSAAPEPGDGDDIDLDEDAQRYFHTTIYNE